MMVVIEGVVAFSVEQVLKDPIIEVALHVGEVLLAVEVVFMVATTAAPLPVPMIKINIKPTSAHTIATRQPPKSPSIKMEVVVMQVEVPPHSTIPKARQTTLIRLTAILKKSLIPTMTMEALEIEILEGLFAANVMTKSMIPLLKSVSSASDLAERFSSVTLSTRLIVMMFAVRSKSMVKSKLSLI
jgi:hypothetical protein